MRDLGTHLHLVGIGGEGMSALAQLLSQLGYQVSGSDLTPSTRLAHLSAQGIRVCLGHSPDNLPPGRGTIVYSSAIPAGNPELRAARARGMELLPRLQALDVLLAGRKVVAIAGTHGKTTTTTWAACLVHRLTGEEGHYIGAQVAGLPAARWGRGPFFLEVDESDGLFTTLSPQVAVIGNIDGDHLSTYGSYQRLLGAFAAFARRARKLAVGGDDPGARRLVAARPDALTFGLSPGCRLRARGVRGRGQKSWFELWWEGRRVGEVEIPAPGTHNVRNALGALAAGILVGLPVEELAEWLPQLPRPRRRLEVLEENGHLVVDDYAHHPRELACSLAGIRAGWPRRRVVAVFQPHRYSRTSRYARAFGEVLAWGADEVVVTEVYPAGEPPLPGVSGAHVAAAARAAGGEVHFAPTLDQAQERVAGIVRPGDVVVYFGAGDIWRLAREMATSLSSGG
jgi:UDP-N-acetylmuramate--alanine ligase